jgi:hypothetical protein
MPGQAAKSQTGEKKGLDRAEKIELAFAGAVPITAAEFGLPTEIRDRCGSWSINQLVEQHVGRMGA